MYCMDLWGSMDGPELLKLLDHLNGPECTPYTEPWDDDGTEDAQKYEFLYTKLQAKYIHF